MTIIGTVCPEDGQNHEWHDCIACARSGTNPCHFTAELLADIEVSTAQQNVKGVRVSTLCSDCFRRPHLEATHDYYANPYAMFWRWRGNIGHALVETALPPEGGEVREERFYAMVALGGEMAIVTGKPDAVVASDTLRDYKTTNRIPNPTYRYECPCGKLIHEGGKLRSRRECPKCGAVYDRGAGLASIAVELPPKPYGHHAEQVNVYRWLLAQNGVTVDNLEIVYIDMRGPLRVRVETWPLQRAEQFVRERATRFLQAQRALPPAGEHWECAYCDVKDICQRLAAEGR